MEIKINNTIKEIADFATIQDMVAFLDIIPAGTAIAVNNAVMPKAVWPHTVLKPTDSVTIIRATQGG